MGGGGGPGVALPSTGPGDTHEVGDLGPGALLVPGVGHRFWETGPGLRQEAGEEVQGDAGIAVVEASEGGEGIQGGVEYILGVGPGGGGQVVVTTRLSHGMWITIQFGRSTGGDGPKLQPVGLEVR